MTGWRLAALAAVTMCAFAANSVLNRLALADGAIDPGSFAVIRTIAGAAMLWVLVFARRRPAGDPVSWPAVLALTAYMVAFSLAYVTLATGTGALILFGGVQLTMFAGTLLAGGRVVAGQWLGAALAFAGLVVLLLPSSTGGTNLWGAALMTIAAVGWGVYSLIGRRATDALGMTATNFALAIVPVLVLSAVMIEPGSITVRGAVLAVIAGAVTSGLGYALWYRSLPHLEAPTAAVLQLTVPLIAAIGGTVFLGEALTWRMAVTAALIAIGVTLSARVSARARPFR